MAMEATFHSFSSSAEPMGMTDDPPNAVYDDMTEADNESWATVC